MCTKTQIWNDNEPYNEEEQAANDTMTVMNEVNGQIKEWLELFTWLQQVLLKWILGWIWKLPAWTQFEKKKIMVKN